MSRFATARRRAPILLLSLALSAVFVLTARVTSRQGPPASATSAGAPGAPAGTRQRVRPNVLIVLLDDVGLESLSFAHAAHAEMGIDLQGEFDFPRMDTLERWAGEGVLFDELWVTPRCSPTRASLLTGRYPFRHGVGTVVREDELGGVGPNDFRELGDLGPEHPLPERLNGVGYATAGFGKYHLALSADDVVGLGGSGVEHALDFAGWQHFDGMVSGLYSRVGASEIEVAPEVGGVYPGYWNFYHYRDREPRQQLVGEHATQWTRDAFLQWVAQVPDGQPWCALLALHSSHAPLGAAPDNGEGQSGIDPRGTEVGTYELYEPTLQWNSYRAGLEHLDRELAAIEQGIGGEAFARTLVLVLGDNGIPQTVAQNMYGLERDVDDPLATVIGNDWVKSTVHTAGVRNFLIARGPRDYVREPGRVTRAPVDVVDVYATVAEVAEAPLPSGNFDGVSFLPLLRSSAAEADPPREFQWTETFEPNGSPFDLRSGGVTLQTNPSNPATPGTTRNFLDAPHIWDRALALEYEGVRYKLVRRFDGQGGEVDRLYDLDTDPYELRDLTTAHPAYMTLAIRMFLLLYTEQLPGGG